LIIRCIEGVEGCLGLVMDGLPFLKPCTWPSCWYTFQQKPDWIAKAWLKQPWRM